MANGDLIDFSIEFKNPFRDFILFDFLSVKKIGCSICASVRRPTHPRNIIYD